MLYNHPCTELVAGEMEMMELVALERKVTELSVRAQRRQQRQEEEAVMGSFRQPEAKSLALCGLLFGFVTLFGFLMYSVGGKVLGVW